MCNHGTCSKKKKNIYFPSHFLKKKERECNRKRRERVYKRR